MKTYPIYESPKKEANEERYGLTGKSCVCCGKPTAQKLWIHATTDWVACDEADSDKVPNSQGAFPIGPECAKRFPKEFIFVNGSEGITPQKQYKPKPHTK